MPKNKNAFKRYQILDDLLSDKHRYYTCNDLLHEVNKRLEVDGLDGQVTKRTIQLDLQALQDEPFYMEIDNSTKDENGISPIYRYTDQTKSLFAKPLSQDEKRLLHEVLNTLGQFKGLNNFEWLNNLQEKLNEPNSFGRKIYNSQTETTRKIISFSANNELQGTKYLASLFSFISNKNVIDIMYAPFGENVRLIRIHPYLLKQFNDRWFLIGKPFDNKTFPYKYINLPLDRIERIHIVPRAKYIECPEDLEEEWFYDIIGVTNIADSQKTTIIFAVKNQQRGYIDTKPLHGSQFLYSSKDQVELHKKYKRLKDYTFYGINIKPNREFYKLIYSHGADIVVLEPEDIRKKMSAEISQMLKIIENL